VTDDNIRHNVTDELALADSDLRAADALLGLDISPAAASRTYYAVFHATRALLLSVGIQSSSHKSLRSLFAQHFVKTGLLPAERSKELAQLEALRSSGDYDSSFALGPEEIRPELDKARRFVDDARELLRRGGWLA
jgi:uncharacterized protein (UPF0332 family)